MGYTEICAVLPAADTSIFCESSDDLYNYNAHRGPFIMYGTQTLPNDGSIPDKSIQRIPIYRCLNNNNHRHFIAKTINCDNINNSKMEYILGYAAISPSTAMPRRLVRCQINVNSNDIAWYHAVGDNCENGDSGTLLGFVL